MIAYKEAATARDHAAMAEKLRAEAAPERTREGRHRGAAEEVLAEARERVAAILTAAEAEARTLTAEAERAMSAAIVLEQRAQWAEAAAGNAEAAEKAEALAAALGQERDALAAQAAELGVQLGHLQAERGDVGVQLAAALEAGDLDAVADCRARVSAMDELAASLSARQVPLRARIEAIGTGEQLGTWPQKELRQAMTAAAQHRSGERQALNLLDPDRPEADLDRRRAAYLNEMLPRASDTARAPEPRTYVHM